MKCATAKATPVPIVSTKELQCQLGVTYRTAWRIGYEIRLHMPDVVCLTGLGFPEGGSEIGGIVGRLTFGFALGDEPVKVTVANGSYGELSP